MIDPKLLSIVKVVETGSYTKAAKQLALSQPAVSQHIRLLEESLQVKLFERAHNTLHVTREGEIVVKYARRMITLQNNLQRELKSQKSRIASLTVGITHTAESNLIVEAIAAYAHLDVAMTIRIITTEREKLYSMLKNYELDFAVTDGRPDDPSLQHLLLDTDYLVLAVSPSHPFAKKQTVTIDELKKEKMILRLPKAGARNLFEETLKRHKMHIEDFNVILEIDNVATITDLIRRDLGVAVLARSVCVNELKKDKLVTLSIENLNMSREINLVYAQDFEHVDLLRAIIKQYQVLQEK